jgi:hypothetical protein
MRWLTLQTRSSKDPLGQNSDLILLAGSRSVWVILKVVVHAADPMLRSEESIKYFQSLSVLFLYRGLSMVL